MTAHEPLTAPAAQVGGAVACLQASLLLRRRAHRSRDTGVGDKQALLAVCQLLDALGRGLGDQSGGNGAAAVERAVLRLADQLGRAESADSHRSGSGGPPVGPGCV